MSMGRVPTKIFRVLKFYYRKFVKNFLKKFKNLFHGYILEFYSNFIYLHLEFLGSRRQFIPVVVTSTSVPIPAEHSINMPQHVDPPAQYPINRSNSTTTKIEVPTGTSISVIPLSVSIIAPPKEELLNDTSSKNFNTSIHNNKAATSTFNIKSAQKMNQADSKRASSEPLPFTVILFPGQNIKLNLPLVSFSGQYRQE